MKDLPPEVRLEIILETCSKGKVGEYSMTDSDLWGRRNGLLFSSGADEVECERATYKKVSDKAHFDNAVAVRSLVYQKKVNL